MDYTDGQGKGSILMTGTRRVREEEGDGERERQGRKSRGHRGPRPHTSWAGRRLKGRGTIWAEGEGLIYPTVKFGTHGRGSAPRAWSKPQRTQHTCFDVPGQKILIAAAGAPLFVFYPFQLCFAFLYWNFKTLCLYCFWDTKELRLRAGPRNASAAGLCQSYWGLRK